VRTGVFHETFASEERLWTRRPRAAGCSRSRRLVHDAALGRDYVLAMACIVGIHVIATLGLNLTTGNAG
jgi:branched-chain amino acid transport system permease protein